MSSTQAELLSDFRDYLGDVNSNIWTDYQLISSLRRAYEQAWPDWYLEVLDDNTYTGYASLPPGTLSVPVPDAFIGGKIYNIFGRTNRYQQGVYFTNQSGSLWFVTTAPHTLSQGQQVQINGGSLPGGFSYWGTYYATYPSASGVAFNIPFASPTFTSGGAHGYEVGMPVILTGSVPGGFTSGLTYYVAAVPTSLTLQLAATLGGPAITAAAPPLTSSNVTIGYDNLLTFQLSATSGGSAIASTSSGSGYAGAYVDPTNDRVPFNQWTRGIRIDPLTSTTPRIRFTRRDSWPFEMRIEGASVLAYPYQTATVAATDTFTAVTGYTPFNGDTVYFYAVAPTSFSTGSLTGVGGKTPYYVVNTSGQTFKLSATAGGAAISTTSSGTYKIFPGSQVLPGTNLTWLNTFLKAQGEVETRRERQRSGNLDRRAMAQRRLLAQQEVTEARKHRMQPHNFSMFSWDG